MGRGACVFLALLLPGHAHGHAHGLVHGLAAGMALAEPSDSSYTAVSNPGVFRMSSLTIAFALASIRGGSSRSDTSSACCWTHIVAP